MIKIMFVANTKIATQATSLDWIREPSGGLSSRSTPDDAPGAIVSY